MQRDEVKRRRVGCTVIGRVRNQLEVCELSIADLVQDLAWLRVTVVVLGLRLQRTQNVEAATRKVRIDQKVLQRNDQAVPTKRGDKPRQSGGWQEHLVIRAKDRQSKRSHILECLAIKAVELLVAATNFQHCPQPIRQGLTVPFVTLLGALLGSSVGS